MFDSILTTMNEAQRAAVVYRGGPLLIIAGAGSGKTRVLTTRIMHMIREGVPPLSILAVTFTNKAAGEMRKRVQSVMKCHVTIGTFHSICLTILRACASYAGLKSDFSIYDDSDQLTLIKECMQELSIDEKRITPKRIRERISAAKDALTTVESLENSMTDYEDRLFVPIFKRYEEKKQYYNGVDFGDLIAKAVKILVDNPAVLESYRDRYRYVLVDEYQDTNYAQYVFINLLAQKYRNITVVGDPDQSIYEWRGADIKNILNFEKDYHDAHVIRLEQNYRSTNTILKAANAVIAHNINRKPKNLWSDRGDGELIELYAAMDERAEARYVVQQVVKYRDAGRSLKEQVIFYRVHAQSRIFEEELRRANIQYQIVGGVKFYARKEVKDILAYLKVIANTRDEVSVKRIVNVPKRGIGDKLFEKVRHVQNQEGCSLFEALDLYARSDAATKREQNGIGGFIAAIAESQERLKQEGLTEFVRYVLERSGYLEDLKADKTIEARMRFENIEELLNSIAEFEESLALDVPAPEKLRQYLEMISLQTSVDSLEEADEVVTLMTLHCAKGLEFPIVYMVGMEEELLPHSNSMGGSHRELEEERRLCYVGMTRAQEQLVMTHAHMRKVYGYERPSKPSRFLREIPREYFKTVRIGCGESIEDIDIELDDGDGIHYEFDDEQQPRRPAYGQTEKRKERFNRFYEGW